MKTLCKKDKLDLAAREFDTAPITQVVSDLVGRPLPLGSWSSLMFDVVVHIDAGEYTLLVDLHPPLNILNLWADCHRCGKNHETGFQPRTADDFEKVASALKSRKQSNWIVKLGRRLVGNCRH